MIIENAKWVLEHISELAGKKVLVVGDIGIDMYLMGEVKRLSPEAPVPVLDVASESQRLGLAANVAQNIHSLGGMCHLVSVVGADTAAGDMKALLKNHHVGSYDLVVDGERPTTRKMRLLSGQHHIARVDFEKSQPVGEKVKAELIHKAVQAIPNYDIMILQDYSKGVMDVELAQQLIQKCREHNKKVLVDPYKTTPLNYYKGAFLMTPNRDEAFSLARQLEVTLTDNNENVDKVGKLLKSAINSENMVVTLGSQGMKLFEGNTTKHLPTFAQNVFDVTGAGDTVISAMGLALAAGWSLEKACYLANFAAGVVVGKIGCVPCDLAELRAFISKHLE
ncbi:MAG: D-glycero-beta-D-manno-heptose-7-phosphate kinase [Bdellovibrionaceae bacterium]|nr:D-glycero-beta-D-manno-heptose-7-phosphate kinase [Pseudobdellovibrionaceae bacterium]